MQFIRKLQQVSDPVLDELMDAATGTPKAWLLLANPQQAPAISVVYLTGQTSPTLRKKISDVSEPLGWMWDIFMDCGVAPVDFRFAALNYGK